jgi:hypothetical protein
MRVGDELFPKPFFPLEMTVGEVDRVDQVVDDASKVGLNGEEEESENPDGGLDHGSGAAKVGRKEEEAE